MFKLTAVIFSALIGIFVFGTASATFSPPMPTITEIQPEVIQVGDIVTITGHNFGVNNHPNKFVALRVYQNIVPSDVLEVITWSDNEIVAKVVTIRYPYPEGWWIFVGYQRSENPMDWVFSSRYDVKVILPSAEQDPEVQPDPEIEPEPEVQPGPEIQPEPETNPDPVHSMISFTGDYELTFEDELCYVEFGIQNTFALGILSISLYSDGELDSQTLASLEGLVDLKLLFTKGCPEREVRIVIEVDGNIQDMLTIDLNGGPIIIAPIAEFTDFWDISQESGYCYLRWGVVVYADMESTVEIYFDGALVAVREWSLAPSTEEMQFMSLGIACPTKHFRVKILLSEDETIELFRLVPILGEPPVEEEVSIDPPPVLFLPNLSS